MSAAGSALLVLWSRLAPFPLGRHLFSWVLSRRVPYSGTVRPHIEALEPGYARITMRDRRRVRNHLRSIHAIALANLAELSSGLALTTALPPDVRGIVVRMRIEYLRKARGPLVAESRWSLPTLAAESEHDVTAEVMDASGSVVARGTVTWRLGAAPSK
jgi:acyl-coenzyme A thioesterase PaaI-like protein